jgi:hypothetical protein
MKVSVFYSVNGVESLKPLNFEKSPTFEKIKGILMERYGSLVSFSVCKITPEDTFDLGPTDILEPLEGRDMRYVCSLTTAESGT